MAYITAAEVSEIRKALKAEFPNVKFSVALSSGHLGVDVNVMSSKDQDFSAIVDKWGTAQINEYHLHFYPGHEKFLQRVIDIIKLAPAKAEGGREWFDKSDAMTDYFHTAFYIHLGIGKWNKPYQFLGEKEAA